MPFAGLEGVRRGCRAVIANAASQVRPSMGWLGRVVNAMGEPIDGKGPLVAFEIHLDALPLPKYKPTKVKPKLSLSGFQPVTRDFAFIVDQATAASEPVQSPAPTSAATKARLSVTPIAKARPMSLGT
eukprot:gene35220-biopygen23003